MQVPKNVCSGDFLWEFYEVLMSNKFFDLGNWYVFFIEMIKIESILGICVTGVFDVWS